MPIPRNRKIKKKTKVRLYPSAFVQEDLNKLTAKERIITSICIVCTLATAGALGYCFVQDKKDQKVITAFEIEAARQKIQNANTVNFMDTIRKNMR